MASLALGPRTGRALLAEGHGLQRLQAALQPGRSVAAGRAHLRLQRRDLLLSTSQHAFHGMETNEFDAKSRMSLNSISSDES